MARKKLIVVQVAALGYEFARRQLGGCAAWQAAKVSAPALTCPVQAFARTLLPARKTGILANGYFDRTLRKPFFWEQSAVLVSGARTWEKARAAGLKVGLLFWQQSLGEAADLVLSPKPVHKHHGGMIQDCYSQPEDLYARLCAQVGRPFNLMHYWGPLASGKSSAWITDALVALLADAARLPGLLLAYLPHLDYDLQRFGPAHARAARAARELAGYLQMLRMAAEKNGCDWLFFGDYAIEPATGGAIFPNVALREAGLFSTRRIQGMAYPDFFCSQAFALCDHQIAHVYLLDPQARARTRALLEKLPGVAEIREAPPAPEAHAREGDWQLVAAPGHWFAYPWWRAEAEAPDYARHVDIHNKPGYDPCELFWGWPPMSISRDPTRIKGTHGRDCQVAWASSLPLSEGTGSLAVVLAQAYSGLAGT